MYDIWDELCCPTNRRGEPTMGIEKQEDIVCPFCSEKDFDLEGLKIHLTSGHCEEFSNILIINRMRIP
jgi:hypothetical protein